MSGFEAFVLVAICAAVLIPWAILAIAGRLRAVYDREDASLKAQRTPGMGEPLSVPAPEWCNAPHTTGPYYDDLAAEAGRAARDLDVEWWLENGGTTA